jgi:hypothetical protein
MGWGLLTRPWEEKRGSLEIRDPSVVEVFNTTSVVSSIGSSLLQETLVAQSGYTKVSKKGAA